MKARVMAGDNVFLTGWSSFISLFFSVSSSAHAHSWFYNTHMVLLVLFLPILSHLATFTGGAGTGKSFLVHNLIKALKKKVGSRGVAITATTGMNCRESGISTRSCTRACRQKT